MLSKIFRTIPGLLIMLIGCSGSQQTSKGGLPTDPSTPGLHWEKQLRIDNGINRGISYTDAHGTDFNLRYIPITIRNDSINPLHVQIAFSKEYDYPGAHDPDKFKIIPLPEKWALEGLGVTESMYDALPDYIENPLLNRTIEPGEEFVFAIGTLYPSPPKTTGVLPRTLFTHSNSGMFPTCDWLMKSNSPTALGLKLVFGENCVVVPCGQVSYPEQ